MASSKISLLTAAGAAAATNEFGISEAGVSKKLTMAQIAAYHGSGGKFNASIAAQGPGFAADTYLTDSGILIPAGALQVRSMYRCKFNIVKTGAGTATPIINVRFGTNGTTADTSRGTLTHTAQTAVIDEGVYEFFATFRAIGASAVLQSLGRMTHRLVATGFGNTAVSEPEIATSGTFDSGVANSIIGLSVNGGTSAAWTVSLVQAELFNLV